MLLILLGCSPEFDILISPARLDLGVVDFAQEMPEEGYAPGSVSLINKGTGEPQLALLAYDDVHLCLPGYTGLDLPATIGTLPEGATASLLVAACGYEPGERDSEVYGTVTVGTGGTPSTVEIPVVFTPTRTFGDDTG